MRLFSVLILFAFTLAAPALAERPVLFTDATPASGALVLPLADEGELATRGAMLDPATREAVARALASADFKYRANAILRLRGLGPWSQILVIGTGDAPLDPAGLQDIGGTAAQQTDDEDGPVALVATGLGHQAAAELAVGARLGGYSFDRYRSEDPEDPRPAGRDAPLTIITAAAREAEGVWARNGDPLAAGAAFARDLINDPANILYPESFVERAREAFRGVPNVRVRVLDTAEMERLGMGSILSVGQGSARPPRMLVVEYRGPRSSEAPIVLAGKGITFDTGGISIKSSGGMWAMKGDMAGAAAVVGTALSLARSQAPVHVVALAALAENMPGSRATRPGDVVRAMNGKTIEILNTDAEGRLVLADAVAYAERQYDPAAIVDIATLTGSVGAALGDQYAGLFSDNEALAAQLMAAGETSGEDLWRLPLNPAYAKRLRSDVADIKNVAEGQGPGASLGAHFIGYFVDETPWAHLDIAGVDRSTSSSPTVPEGMAGFGVRLLDRFVRDFRPVPVETAGDE